ncbi:MAG TPA: GNAT family N-acetyltransferase [Candidatus Anoxymicrobiaceae bacterium]|jgi:ribosomal protein S18 acetylase RimI-like enzyme
MSEKSASVRGQGLISRAFPTRVAARRKAGEGDTKKGSSKPDREGGSLKAATLAGREYTLRQLHAGDVRLADKFASFINSFAEEPEAMTSIKYRMTIEGERQYLKDTLFLMEAARRTFAVAECAGSIVGLAHVELMQGRKEHVGEFGILVARGHRGVGLGDAITAKVLADSTLLVPRPTILRLSVFANNEIATSLYRKHGFREVARIPEQFEFGESLVDELIMMKSPA